MADDRPLVAVTFRLGRDQLAELFGDEVRAEAVAELPEGERGRTLAAADALLVWNWRREFHPDEGRTCSARRTTPRWCPGSSTRRPGGPPPTSCASCGGS